MKTLFVVGLIIFSGCQVCLAQSAGRASSSPDYSKISPREIAATAAHLSRLLHDAEAQTRLVQDQYDQAAAQIVAQATTIAQLKLSLHETAKERDVVVIFFACAFALGVFSSMGRWIGSLPLFEQILIAVALLAAGYGIGRYILFYLAHLIP